MKLYETLIAQLKCENDFVSDNDEVKKWVVADKARNYDATLLALLLGNDDLRKTFFKDVAGTTIFLKDEFLLFIEQKNYLNDSYTAYRNKIGLTIGGRFLNQRNEVELVWPYKDCILEGGQTKEDQKRPEIFFNQTLAQDETTQLLDPKVLTNYKRYGKFVDDAIFHRDAELNEKRGLPKDTITDNLIIKGNNLLALHCLKKEFAGKVKLIYIDPPYNTGNDSFGYNDSFNHSTWLTFMKNRLEIASRLLKDDGVIFVQCDDNEQSYLKILLDEIFKKENYLSTIFIQVRYSDKQLATSMVFHKLVEHIFLYSKTSHPTIYQEIGDYTLDKYVYEVKEKGKPSKTLNLGGKKVEVFSMDNYEIIKHETGFDKGLKEIWASGKILDSSSTGRFFRDYLTGRSLDDGLGVLYKVHGIGSGLGYRYITGPKKTEATKGKYYQEVPTEKMSAEYQGDSIAIANFYDMAANFGNCRGEGNAEMRSGKKPEELLKTLIKMTTTDGDIVLDFFGGSGTTAAVAHKMNRQYITCEQIDTQMDLITNRLENVINGDQSGISKSVSWNPKNPTLEDSTNNRYTRNSVIYIELKKYNQTFIERIEAADNTEALLQIWEQMKEKSFLAYNVDIKTQDANMEDFMKLDFAQQKALLYELLDKNQLYVNVSEMNDSRFETTQDERAVTEAFYSKM